MYDKQQFKDWYEKTKDKRQIWQKAYYQKHKEHILEVQPGSISFEKARGRWHAAPPSHSLGCWND